MKIRSFFHVLCILMQDQPTIGMRGGGMTRAEIISAAFPVDD